jgi:hypothetical protein
MSIQEQTRSLLPVRLPYRQKVLGHAVATVENARRNGHTLLVTAEAARLLRTDPDCLLSLADLEDLIARLAADDRVPVQLG